MNFTAWPTILRTIFPPVSAVAVRGSLKHQTPLLDRSALAPPGFSRAGFRDPIPAVPVSYRTPPVDGTASRPAEYPGMSRRRAETRCIYGWDSPLKDHNLTEAMILWSSRGPADLVSFYLCQEPSRRAAKLETAFRNIRPINSSAF
jgi:hypothetical protein